MSSESGSAGSDGTVPPADTQVSGSEISDPSGIHLGHHTDTGHPISIDRFSDRWNSMIVGGMGSCKATSSKQQIRREVKSRDDVQVVVVDLLGDFEDLTWSLDGRHVPVTGTTNLNPLEIHEPSTPERIPDSLDPFRDLLWRGVDWFETYVTQRYGDSLSGDERGVLTAALRRAFQEKGITADPQTHRNRPPTIADIIPQLSDIAHDPLGVDDVATEQKQVTQAACDLLSYLSPLCGKGTDANFAEHTGISALAGDRLTRLDVTAVHSTATQRLLLQGLAGCILEQAKRTDDRVLVVFDQAHILCETAIETVESLLRKGRSYDVSVQLILESTDCVKGDRQIAEQCSMVQIHRMSGDLSPLSLDLSAAEIEQVRTAQVGTPSADHLDALLDVDGTTLPISIALEQQPTNDTEDL